MTETNNTIKLTILGSGVFRPEIDKATSSYLLQTNNENIVFDFGRGCINNLLKTGIDYHKIDKIFITHTHTDHCADLASFLHIALAEPPNRKLRNKDMTIFGPKGIKKTIQHLLEAFNLQNKAPKFKVIINEIEPGNTIRTDTCSVRCFRAKHIENMVCFSYRIEHNGKIISYSGDGGYCPELIECCKNADIAILESSIAKITEHHLSGKTAGKLAQEANVKKLIITHTTPEYRQTSNIKQDATEFFSGTIILAEDLMELRL